MIVKTDHFVKGLTNVDVHVYPDGMQLYMPLKAIYNRYKQTPLRRRLLYLLFNGVQVSVSFDYDGHA